MRLSIQNKLFGGFGIAVALLVTVSIIAYIGLSSIGGASQDIKRSADLDEETMTMIIELLKGMDVESMALIFGYDESVLADF